MNILWPMIGLVFLTAVIWVLMYHRRLSEMREKAIKPQDLATVNQAASRLEDTTAAENFSNLLEAPVLFYLLCLVLLVTDQVTDLQVALAWLYLTLRVVHSVIHVSHNHVVSRWLAYVTSMVCLFVMWGVFAVSLLEWS